MDTDKDTPEEKYSKKETYTADEKQIILDNLDEERRMHQEATKGMDGKKASYNKNEKMKILNKLNQERISSQNREEVKQKRLGNKEVYTFGVREFYKFLEMEREYFVEILDCDKFSRRPAIISLYYKIFDKLKKKDVLIKTEAHSDKIFISYDAMRVYFKAYSLENKR